MTRQHVNITAHRWHKKQSFPFLLAMRLLLLISCSCSSLLLLLVTQGGTSLVRHNSKFPYRIWKPTGQLVSRSESVGYYEDEEEKGNEENEDNEDHEVEEDDTRTFTNIDPNKVCKPLLEFPFSLVMPIFLPEFLKVTSMQAHVCAKNGPLNTSV